MLFIPCISSLFWLEPVSTYGLWPKSACEVAAFRGVLLRAGASEGDAGLSSDTAGISLWKDAQFQPQTQLPSNASRKMRRERNHTLWQFMWSSWLHFLQASPASFKFKAHAGKLLSLSNICINWMAKWRKGECGASQMDFIQYTLEERLILLQTLRGQTLLAYHFVSEGASQASYYLYSSHYHWLFAPTLEK